MIANINPHKDLFRWGPIPFNVFYASFFNEALWLHVHKHYPWPWFPCLALYQGGRAEYIADYPAVRRVGAQYFRRYFLNAKNFQREWQKWQRWVKEYRAFERRLDAVQWRKISDAALHEYATEFYRLNIDFWLACHVPEIANWGGEQLLRKALAKIDPANVDSHLEILAAPTYFSFFQEEELALLQLALLKGARRTRALILHAEKYSWLLNSYGGNRVLRPAYFAKKLRDLLRKGSAKEHIGRIEEQRRANQQRKRVLARQLHLSSLIGRMGDCLSYSIWWQDLRKSYIWRLNARWDVVLHEVARRTRWSFEELLWCWPQEILDLIEGKRFNKKRILARRVLYATFQRKGLLQHFYGRAARRLVERFAVRVDRATTVVRGLAVSRGKGGRVVQGRVTVIRDAVADAHKMRTHDILVAPMTSPEFIVVMKKAKAIVTDHGGMTSHAAIVSRELGIPCIVGTKMATRIFKDGDRVEVDADKGIVRKI